jgi:hypothetical protein
MRERLERGASSDARVSLFLQFVPEESIQRYLRAADLVVLPFSEILNSGSALLALSFDRPILVPAKGAMAELQHELGPDWVRTYSGELTPVVLGQALTAAHARSPRSCDGLTRFGWDALAERTMEAFHQASNAPRGAGLPLERQARV